MKPNKHRANWLVIGILIPSVLILILEIIAWGAILFPSIGDVLLQSLETSTVQVVYMLPLPLGLLSIIVGIISLLKRGSVEKRVTITAIIFGLLGFTTGLLWFVLLAGYFGQIY